MIDQGTIGVDPAAAPAAAFARLPADLLLLSGP